MPSYLSPNFFSFLLACWRGWASCWCFKCSHRVARQCPGCRKDSVWEPTGPTHLLHRVLCRGQGNTSTTKTYLACLCVCCFVLHWYIYKNVVCNHFGWIIYDTVLKIIFKKWLITSTCSNILNLQEPVTWHLLKFGHLFINVPN